MPRTSGSPTPSASRTPGPSPNPVTGEMTAASRHPEMPGQRQEAGRTVTVTAPTGPVRGLFRPRPCPKPCAHGRRADGGGPGRSLKRRMCRPAASASARATGCKTVPYDWPVRPYPVVSGNDDGLAAGPGCAPVYAQRSRKAAGQSTHRLTDLLTRPAGRGETTRDTGDARRGLSPGQRDVAERRRL